MAREPRALAPNPASQIARQTLRDDAATARVANQKSLKRANAHPCALQYKQLRTRAWDWATFRLYFTADTILQAIGRTLELTAYGTVLGFELGAVVAAMRRHGPAGWCRC
ncbi:hypothetical protein ACGF12_03970 [Kitasatospora sp. NPDC048296]|uniref:hypothetical protein n=1 Tax=Kitasatospora sp. NPDC048296 TaxID=3364048 RepID=UPI00371508F9